MKFKLYLFLCLMTATGPLRAEGDFDQQNIGSENIKQVAQGKPTPFNFSTHVDVIGSAKIDKGFYKGDKVRFAEARAETGMIFYYNSVYEEGVGGSIAFEPTFLKWDQNPWFEQDHFNLLSVNLSGFTKRADRWFWRGQLTVNADVEEWSGQYTSYDILLWGRYDYSEDFGIHFGFWAETGLNMDRIYPIAGIDWKISPDLSLNLVYPVNVSLNYMLNPVWSISLAGRFFNPRFRIHQDQTFAKSLIRYTNIGAEFAIRYENENTSANIHAGTTLAGKFRVANRHNRHAKSYNLESALYAGAEIEVKF